MVRPLCTAHAFAVESLVVVAASDPAEFPLALCKIKMKFLACPSYEKLLWALELTPRWHHCRRELQGCSERRVCFNKGFEKHTRGQSLYRILESHWRARFVRGVLRHQSCCILRGYFSSLPIATLSAVKQNYWLPSKIQKRSIASVQLSQPTS